ncbi:hypothetical protein QPK87_35345 [Kamptonema cortianum]|uniref:DUF983 domain-containing protein n=1 Tax=Geitlerinema calcuttense NRMC-F 0142 TaxID=2922238 RepID=A0ABT7M2Q8_9CYAN|nr:MULTISPECIES: hypothetical protein [Cyanophyceae]MDK3161790.1 hypothetical protein [Kamptonema cortianum]MDL5054362.1 hypothetical protein [Oscillatoria laete-virens NRMC-F 0139]MDL5057915.1 hypothetical protein [Geitlerinema calcuttense NRMC-F 0142]
MSNEITPPRPDYSIRKAVAHLRHGLALKCPLCGQHPIFPPLSKTRSFFDWFQPLDGCPKCGYAYEREPGYFLLATWGGMYGFGSLFGLCLYVVIVKIIRPEFSWIWQLVLICVAAALFCFLTARHVKSLFIAFDRFWDQDTTR